MAFLELVWDVFYEDCLILFPILFLTFFFIEYLEHRAGEKFLRRVERAEKMAPCGAPSSAAYLSAGSACPAPTSSTAASSPRERW